MKYPTFVQRVPDIAKVPNRRMNKDEYHRLARIIRNAWYAVGHPVDVTVADGEPPSIISSTVRGWPREAR